MAPVSIHRHREKEDQVSVKEIISDWKSLTDYLKATGGKINKKLTSNSDPLIYKMGQINIENFKLPVYPKNTIMETSTLEKGFFLF